MKQIHANFILPFNTTITKNSHIENLDYSKDNCKSFDSTCDKICVGNGIYFRFQ